MKKLQIILLFSILSTCLFSQKDYKQAYFINNDNEKIDCYIKDMDVRDNPTGFEYIPRTKSESYTANISTVKVFQIGTTKKYIRFSGKIDRTSVSLDNVDDNRNPVWSDEVIFLKTLVEGEASLYVYREGNLVRYFYKSSSSKPIEQLVFKHYRVEALTMGSNKYYQQQLFNNIRIYEMDLKDYETIEYKESELIEYFLNYNNSKGVSSIRYKTLKDRESFNLKVVGGFSLAAEFKAENDVIDRELIFDPFFSFTIGLEAEYILPFWKNRFSLFFNPAFVYFKGEEEITRVFLTIENTYLYEINYAAIDLPFGFRYYAFINNQSKAFIDLAFVTGLYLNSEITMDSSEYLNLQGANNFRLGAGYSIGKHSLSLNFDYNKDLLGDYPTWDSSYNRLTLMFKYQF
ncbi:MAG: hypothetical protein U9N53_11750 [Bacteroidota bacterium]|nr:hypothetical protein [Bacteroidota bacterium]